MDYKVLDDLELKKLMYTNIIILTINKEVKS